MAQKWCQTDIYIMANFSVCYIARSQFQNNKEFVQLEEKLETRDNTFTDLEAVNKLQKQEPDSINPRKKLFC